VEGSDTTRIENHTLEIFIAESRSKRLDITPLEKVYILQLTYTSVLVERWEEAAQWLNILHRTPDRIKRWLQEGLAGQRRR